MDIETQDRLYREGLALYRNQRLRPAAEIFGRLVLGGSQNPLHLSYWGVLTATVQGRIREGLPLCEQAMRLGAGEPEIVVNLARMYDLSGQHARAVELLRRAIRRTPRDRALLNEIQRLSPRRRPIVPGLSRSHPINRFLSLLLDRLGRPRVEPQASPRVRPAR